MRKLIVILVIIGVSGVTAQETNVESVVRGIVVDASGNTPVSYTNIGLEGTYYGTASDAEGNFELKIPEELADRQIFFSAVGYKNKMFPVSDLFEKDFNMIKLEQQSYTIEGVEVSARSKVLARILRTASENISRNFTQGPFNMDCTYSFEKTAGDEKYNLKASVNIYDESGYSSPSPLDAYKNRHYRFSGIERDFDAYLLTDGSTNFDEVLGLDLARSATSVLDPVNLDRMILSQEEDAVLNGIDVWVIGFKQPAPDFEGAGDYYATRFEGRIYINKNNYEVRKIEAWVESEKNNRMGRGLAVDPGTNTFFSDIDYDFTISYNSGGLNFISQHKNYTSGGERISETSQLLLNSTNTSNTYPISSRDYFAGE